MHRPRFSRAMIFGLVMLLGAASVLGLAFGARVAGLTETELIEQVAALHVAQGGRAETCLARPGTGRVWIVVICGEGSDAHQVGFNRLGFEVQVPRKSPGT